MKKLLTLLPYLALLAVPLGFVLFNATYSPEQLRPTAPPRELRRRSFTPIEQPDRAVSVSGIVRGEDGSPLEEALVFATVGGEPRWTHTDASGAFALRGLGAPPFTIAVSHYDHLPTEFLVETREANLSLARLPPAPNLAALEVRTLAGTLSTRDGESLDGYEVQLLPEAAPDVLGGAVPRRASARADGSFELADLSAGKYRVAVLPPWARGGSWPNLLPLARRTYRHGPGSRTLDLPVERGAITGTVVGTEGPLEGAFVLVSFDEGEEHLWPPVQSDVSGAFHVGDLPADHVYVVAVRAGGASASESVYVGADPGDPIEIRLDDAE